MPPIENARTPIAIAGAGRVARALGRFLHGRGEPVALIAGRTPESSRDAAAFIGPGVRPAALADLDAPRLLVCVSDDAIEAVAAAVPVSGGIALHTSGLRGAEALDALARRGVRCGSLHPLQTIPSGAGADALCGAAFAIDGHPEAVAWAESIAALAGGRALRIAAAARPLYHAAAVFSSNYLVALMDASESLLRAAGVAPSDALPALAPLARAALENALALGPAAALTGPIDRGDAGAVAGHLRALADAPAGLAAFYRAAGIHTLAIARRRGLDPDRAAAIENLLRPIP